MTPVEVCADVAYEAEDEAVIGFVNATPTDCDETGLVCVILEDLILDGSKEIC